MRMAEGVNCDLEELSFFAQRICSNLEFQKVDSIMNEMYSILLNRTDSDDKKIELENRQSNWVEKRRFKSSQISDGYRGHHLGIIYLQKMVEMTVTRKEELEKLLQKM